MNTGCPRPQCKRPVAAERFCCSRHWGQLSPGMKRRVFAFIDRRLDDVTLAEIVAEANLEWDTYR